MISNNEFDDWGQQSGSNQNPQDENPGVDLMQVAMRRKGLIALGVFLGLCLGLLYFARATPVYQSRAQLSIDELAAPARGRDDMTFGIGFSGANDHAHRLASSRIVGDTLKANPDLEKLPSLVESSAPVQVILSGLEVQPIEDGSKILNLVYEGSEPEDCSQILDALMQTYDEFLNEKRENVGEQVVQWISKARDDVDLELGTLREEYENWRRDESGLFGDVNLQRQQLARVKDLIFDKELLIGQLSVEINSFKEAIAMEYDADALLVLAQQQNRAGRLSEVDQIERELDQAERERDQRVQTAMFREADVSLRYAEQHPQRRVLERTMKLAEDLFQQRLESIGQSEEDSETPEIDATEKLVTDYVAALEFRVKDAKSQLLELRAKENALADAAKALERDEAKQRSFDDEIARKTRLYDEIVTNLSEINRSEEYGGKQKYRIERIEHPGLGRKTDPTLAKSLAAGTMLGFLAGFGMGYLVEMFDKTFRSPQEVSDMLQLPMIGHIPEIIPEPVEDTKLSETLIAAHKPKSPMAESFRAIRTALYFTTAGQQTRVIQTTSPVPGDGKSTLTANLAITIAQSNKSVLLVDADFRRPTQHKLFGATNETGLASVVIGEADPLEAAQATEVPNLYLMPCGPRPHNPSELLTSPQFADLLEVLREQYDFVLVDTPPVLAVTDPGIVSARVDGVIMALRIRKNGRPGTIRARKILQELDANMLGVVVNGIDQRSGSYGYYSNYRRGYGYGASYGGNYGKSYDKTEKLIGKYFEEPPAEESTIPGNRS